MGKRKRGKHLATLHWNLLGNELSVSQTMTNILNLYCSPFHRAVVRQKIAISK